MYKFPKNPHRSDRKRTEFGRGQGERIPSRNDQFLERITACGVEEASARALETDGFGKNANCHPQHQAALREPI